MITRSTEASWKFRALGESSYGMTGDVPEEDGCVTALGEDGVEPGGVGRVIREDWGSVGRLCGIAAFDTKKKRIVAAVILAEVEM
jgi:hypothetical protein